MSTDLEDLVFIVDETHEDKKCESVRRDCPNEAVLLVTYKGEHTHKQYICLSCHAAGGDLTVRPLRDRWCGKGTIEVLSVNPVPR